MLNYHRQRFGKLTLETSAFQKLGAPYLKIFHKVGAPYLRGGRPNFQTRGPNRRLTYHKVIHPKFLENLIPAGD